MSVLCHCIAEFCLLILNTKPVYVILQCDPPHKDVLWDGGCGVSLLSILLPDQQQAAGRTVQEGPPHPLPGHAGHGRLLHCLPPGLRGRLSPWHPPPHIG